MGIRLLVTGSREWSQVHYLWDELESIHRRLTIDTLVEGCCRGADNAAEAWAEKSGVAIDHYPARWKIHGGQLSVHPPEWSDIIEGCRCRPDSQHCSFAGYRRNEEMLFDGRPDRVAAFHPDIQTSRGTRHMALLASSFGIPVDVFPPSLDSHLSSAVGVLRRCSAPVACITPGCHRAQAHRFLLVRSGRAQWAPSEWAWCEDHEPKGFVVG